MYYKYRKPLLLMYSDNYRYGTGLYAGAVSQIHKRDGDFYFRYRYNDTPSIPMPPIGSREPPTIPKEPLMDHDLYAPVSYGYGRSALRSRPVVPRDPRGMHSRFYPSYYGMDV